jgi:hypothetical protein
LGWDRSGDYYVVRLRLRLRLRLGLASGVGVGWAWKDGCLAGLGWWMVDG